MTAIVLEPAREARRPAPPALAAGTIAQFPAGDEAAAIHRRFLAQVASARDSRAFLALFNHFAPRLKAYMKRLGAADELAEELAQDVMFTVWRKAESYDPAKSAVSSWIFTIARNLRIDGVRREQRRVLDRFDPLLAPAAQELPDRALEAVEEQRRVRTVLATLPREQAAVVSLAIYEGKSHGEIACDLAIPLGTVKSRMRLAFQRLRAALDPAHAVPARAAA
jgi:RNA polymerase sigma-70 factor (ECF subfamily)